MTKIGLEVLLGIELFDEEYYFLESLEPPVSINTNTSFLTGAILQWRKLKIEKLEIDLQFEKNSKRKVQRTHKL